MTNTGDIPVQVIARHWVIDDHGVITVVRGLGVIGQQPLIQPNERYSYQSFCHLQNKVGTMKGHFTCIAEDAHLFEAIVPEFLLVADEGMIH
jgi:ApaG protein